MCRDYVMMIYRDGDTGKYFIEICDDFFVHMQEQGRGNNGISALHQNAG